MCAIVLGFHIIGMYLTVKVYAYNKHFVPRGTIDWNKRVPENLIIGTGAGVTLLGIILSVIAVINWQRVGFGALNPDQIMRITIPAIMLIIVGAEGISTGFIIGIMKIKSNPAFSDIQPREQKK